MSPALIPLPMVMFGSETAPLSLVLSSATFSCSFWMFFAVVSGSPCSFISGVPVVRVPACTSMPTTAGFDCLKT